MLTDEPVCQAMRVLQTAGLFLEPLCATGACQVRGATKKAGGSTKNSKGSNAQRLGVKLFDGQACKAGSIIVRQRGTKWKLGENVRIGKDDTIYSMFAGRVNFWHHLQTKRTHVGVIPAADLPVKPLKPPR